MTNFKWKKIAPTPPLENLVVLWWQVSNKINCPHPTTRKSWGLVVTNYKKTKIAPPNLKKSRSLVVKSFKWKKNCPHPTTRKLFCLIVTNLKYTKNCCKLLQITPCQIGLPWPYVVGFSAQLYDDMYKCHQLTYSTLSFPHIHCFQWFPRLDGPRGKHPWLTKYNCFSQTGLNWL